MVREDNIIPWNIKTIPLPNRASDNWGIEAELLSTAKEILYNDDATEEIPGVISFRKFVRLAIILREAGAKFTDINEALRFWISQSKETETELTKVIQTYMKSFGGGGKLIVDGIVGPKTKSLLVDILGVFGVGPLKYGTTMREILERLSLRVIRIKTSDSSLLTNDSNSPLILYVNDNSASFEFKEEPLPGLYFSGEDTMLADLSKDVKLGNSLRDLDFLQWLMLLQFPDFNRPDSVSPEFSFDGEKWQPILNNNLPIGEKPFKPDQYFDVTGNNSIRLRFISVNNDERAIFCILLNEDFSHISTPIIPGIIKDKLVNEVQIDLPKKMKFPKVQNGAFYLKVFILDNLYADLGRGEPSVITSGKSFDEPFYLLMNAAPSSIEMVFTLGLLNHEDSSTDLQPFRDEWILVAGTGTREIPEDQNTISEALGKALAMDGYGLICGGWPGVDEAVAWSFRNTLVDNGISERERLIQMINTDLRPIYDYGMVEHVSKDWYNHISKPISAFIMIGGEGGTYDIYKTARKLNIPVIPIMTTGGDAARAYYELKDVSEGYHLDFFPGSFFVDKINEVNALAKARLILNGIRQALKLKRPKLREQAIQMDKERQVIFPDDLQKGRWGGSAISLGVVLSARIGKPDEEGNYAVRLTVSFDGWRTASDEVAFFLHDTYEKIIHFVKVKEGKAILNIRAYEAFTVGALTSDGSTLELDLNTVKGGPEGFYYPEINEEFRRKVGQLYNQTPVIVADDLQKERWGGRASRSRKKLSATVTKNGSANTYTLVAEISGEPVNSIANDVAFFLHDTFEAEILFAKVKDGIASITVQAYEAFTIGACATGGELLELDLQTQPGFPKGFYYTKGSFSFYKEREVLNLIAADQKLSNLVIKNYRALLFFETNEQHTWLIIAQEKCYIVLDDRETRKQKIAIQARFKTADVKPIDTRKQDGNHSVKFSGQKNRWLFSPHLFTGNSIVESVSALLDDI